MTKIALTSATEPVLHTDLTPCNPRQVVKLLGPLFRNLDSFRKFTEGPKYSDEWKRGQDEQQEAMAVYVRPILNEPAWAIEQAVQRFLDGLVERHPSQHGKVPKCDEFAIEVRSLTKHQRKRDAELKAAELRKRESEEFQRLEAARKEPVSEANRERLKALLAKTTEAMQ
jgi:hypothetical protein